jgi:kojibiose phosphorylase
VFWDTEMFMLPFFTLTYPEAARALLKYRYHTLPAARARAAQQCYQGALFAWESADTGEDVTPSAVVAPTGELIRIHVGNRSTQRRHRVRGVARWQATADERFLLEAGAEIVFETARFWASRASREADSRYHIRRVIGPDEYHSTVDDNAYTNGMAQWNLEIAVEAAELLRQRWPAR